MKTRINRTDTKKYPQVAVGVLLMKAGKVLLVRRKNPPAQHMWALPGGRIRWGETMQQAAKREIKEETGLDIETDEIIHTFDIIDVPNNIHYIIIDLLGRVTGGKLCAGDDAEEVRWVSREQIPDLAVNKATRDLLRDTFDFD